jgi:hypothetical protein
MAIEQVASRERLAAEKLARRYDRGSDRTDRERRCCKLINGQSLSITEEHVLGRIIDGDNLRPNIHLVLQGYGLQNASVLRVAPPAETRGRSGSYCRGNEEIVPCALPNGVEDACSRTKGSGMACPCHFCSSNGYRLFLANPAPSTNI